MKSFSSMASSDQQGSCHLKFKSNSPSLLRVPSGEVWRVELTKSDGKIWLENGWHQFSNHYTLDFGYLLVFRYDGNSNFHNNDEFQHNDSTPIRKPQLPCPRPHKMMKTNATIKTETECNENLPWIQIAIAVTFSVMSSLPRCGHSGCYCEYNGYIERQLYLYFADAIAVADYYLKPDADNTNQLCQETLMKKLCSSTLSDSSGKTWTATLKQRQREKARFGDKLDGELLHRITLSKSVIERKAPSCASPSCPETLTDLHKAKALQIASAFKSENPFFVMVLHPSHVNSNRLVSFELKPAAEYTSEFCKAISVKDAQIGHTSLSNGKSWPVICYKYSSDGPKLNVRFGNGWRKFSVENNLELVMLVSLNWSRVLKPR
ncbi:B3 domain-containing protein Os11g0197600-like [Hibiscus syriacus]|uniref:B3 domain-containing protein Os11g0197600-like n=1 Tax=Hibiscus syriacus TaxID=106335 RepID=UPI00192402B4|nr:B3 domain-containing protein Os11g0197600-like [Hibiscus syriacus]